MKVKATYKEIKNQKPFILGVGYCQAQSILRRLDLDPTLYNSGVYGWRCDFYPIDRFVGIVTGYNYERACTHKISDFNDKAKELFWKYEEKELPKEEFIQFLHDLKNGKYNK